MTEIVKAQDGEVVLFYVNGYNFLVDKITVLPISIDHNNTNAVQYSLSRACMNKVNDPPGTDLN